MVAEAKINPAMMKWARAYAGFINGYEEKLPKYIKPKYKSWENGEKLPTWNQLRKVSKKYKVPTAFFFMNNLPKSNNFPELINYRKLDTTLTFESNSPSLISNIRKSETRREIYLELLEEMGKEIKPFKRFNSKLNKYKFAEYIRDCLDISLDTQKNWYKENKDYEHYKFLNNWKDFLNKKLGILIFETKDVDITEMRGLCIFYDEIPIILLNGKDTVNGEIFSLFHELTHLLLGESAICDEDEDDNVEVFCNSVAGEFLVPRNDLIKNIKEESNLSDSLLKKLSNDYGVSTYVILRRLYDIQAISKEIYDARIKNFEDLNHKNKGDGGFYLNNQIKYNGKAYYSLILSAYDSGVINTSDFTRFTNLSQKQIPVLQEKLNGGE